MSAGSRFDRTADQYAVAARKRDWDDLVAWCEPQPEDRVLDVAGGTGALAEALLPRVGSITVSDVSEAMLAHVGEGVRTLVARAEQLPIPDDSFDLVVCVHALHHIDRPVRAIDEMARVLVPGGRLVLEDFIADDDRGSALRWEEAERLRDPDHVRLLTSGEARGRGAGGRADGGGGGVVVRDVQRRSLAGAGGDRAPTRPPACARCSVCRR